MVVEKALNGQRLQRENRRFENLVGTSWAMQQVFQLIAKVANVDSTVLICGETGTGKELIARAIHSHSRRAEKPLIPINCGAIPEGLLESELFGHERGAFTGATHTRVGRFELAHEGTLFLDEVSEMSPSLQVKLLRVLQEQCFERVGGTRSLQVDVRILAATNRDLEQAVARGEFREDLYYRLSVIPLTIPPLRQRKQDIPLLLGHFLDQFNGLHHAHVADLSPRVLDILLNYSWPGNVRELENFVERLVVLKGDGVIQPEDLPEKMGGTCTTGPTVPMLGISAEGFHLDEAVTEYEQTLIAIALPKANGVKHAEGFRLDEAVTEYEQTLIAIALQKANGVKHKAAQLLGMKRTTLIEKLKRYRGSAKVTL